MSLAAFIPAHIETVAGFQVVGRAFFSSLSPVGTAVTSTVPTSGGDLSTEQCPHRLAPGVPVATVWDFHTSARNAGNSRCNV